MKTNLLSFALMLASATAFAQIQLEHTYPIGWLTRVNTDVSGERYMWISNSQPYIVRVFDADHTDNGISFDPFGSNNSLRFAGIPFLSEKLLDNDPEMELLAPWYYDGEDVFGTKLVQESGGVNDFFCNSFNISLIPTPKLICSRKVYTLPGLVLEHDYNDFYEIRRKVFPIDGERYLLAKRYSNYDGIHVYDAAHNWVKTFDTALGNQSQLLSSISQTNYNDDALLEVAGKVYLPTPDANGNNVLYQVIQEDGTVLLSEPCIDWGYSSVGIILKYYSAPGQLTTKVLDTKSYALLHTFLGKVGPFSPDGIKNYFRLDAGSSDTLVIYDGDTYIAKSISLGYNVSTMQFARNRFEKTGKLEIFFNVPAGPASSIKKIVWIDEDGIILHTFENATSAIIDKQPGMQDKLFVRYPDSIQVYHFSSPSSTSPGMPEAITMSAAPNPFSNTIELTFPSTGDYAVRVTNIVGQCILTQMVKGQGKTTLNVPSNAANGIYFIDIEGKKLQKCIRVIKAWH